MKIKLLNKKSDLTTEEKTYKYSNFKNYKLWLDSVCNRDKVISNTYSSLTLGLISQLSIFQSSNCGSNLKRSGCPTGFFHSVFDHWKGGCWSNVGPAATNWEYFKAISEFVAWKCESELNIRKLKEKLGIILGKVHCVKSVQIWSYFWSVFSCI